MPVASTQQTALGTNSMTYCIRPVILTSYDSLTSTQAYTIFISFGAYVEHVSLITNYCMNDA